MGCKKNRFKKFMVSIIAFYFMLFLFLAPIAIAQPGANADTWMGPHLEKIRYVYLNISDPVDPDSDQFRAPIQALIDGDIDVMTTQAYLPDDIEALRTTPNVELVEFYRFSVCYADINCARWPLNISGVRKALHLAIDKNAMGAIQGLQPQDSNFVAPFPFSIEADMTHHYYEAEVSEGASLLDSLGFVDIDSDGWREGPGGIEIPAIEIKFWRSEVGGPLNEDNANLIVDALHNLNLTAYSTRISDESQAYALLSSFDFDIYLFGLIAHDMTLDSWVNFWLEQPGWSNATFEARADVALHSVDYNEVMEAMKELQSILIEDAPGIFLIRFPLYSAYRKGQFNGIVDHLAYGPHSFFTGLNASGDSASGTIRFGTTHAGDASHETIQLQPKTCDVDVCYWFSVKNHMELMYDSLAMIGPDLNVINWLAESYSIETHDDNPAIPDGNTRIVVDLVRNARFSDGTRLTARDVLYSILWFSENFNYQETYGDASLPFDISSCFASGPFQVELQLTTESFWHWYKICFTPIIPFHALDQYDRVSSSGFSFTPEDFNENLVVSGPFMASEWVLGEYIDIVPNPFYWKKPPKATPTTSTPITTTKPPPSPFLPIIAGIAGAATVITVGGFAILRKD
ncbi:MAG: ABC transporter substrate-binding protein [Candidatus Thorarchaeota archaeon]